MIANEQLFVLAAPTGTASLKPNRSGREAAQKLRADFLSLSLGCIRLPFPFIQPFWPFFCGWYLPFLLSLLAHLFCLRAVLARKHRRAGHRPSLALISFDFQAQGPTHPLWGQPSPAGLCTSSLCRVLRAPAVSCARTQVCSRLVSQGGVWDRSAKWQQLGAAGSGPPRVLLRGAGSASCRFPI